MDSGVANPAFAGESQRSPKQAPSEQALVESPTLLLVRGARVLLGHPVMPYVFCTASVMDGATANLGDLDADSSPFTVVGHVLSFLGKCCMCVNIFSLYSVVQPDCGAMAALATPVTAARRLRLQLWNGAVGLLCVPFAGLGLLLLLRYAVAGQPSPLEGSLFALEPGRDSLTAKQRITALAQAINTYSIIITFMWYLSLKQASGHVTDVVRKAAAGIQAAEVRSTRWDDDVVPTVLSLVMETLPTLSRGFGPGLAGTWAGMWTMAMGQAVTIEDGTSGALAVMGPLFVITLSLPLLISLDVTGASSEADGIIDSLNDKRLESVLDPETDTKLQILERALLNANRSQGIGFVVLGKVVTRATLKAIFLAVVGFLGTVVPVLLTLRPAEVASVGACELDAVQRVRLQEHAQLLVANNTCALNITFS